MQAKENNHRRKPSLISLGLALLTLALIAPCAVRAAETSALRAFTLSVGRVAPQERTYAYYVSPKANRVGFNPVVYAFHDNGQTVEDFAVQSGWLKVADDYGLVIVFPEAAKGGWSPVSSGEDAYLKAVFDHTGAHLTFEASPGTASAGAPVPPGGGHPPINQVLTGEQWQYVTGAGAGALVAQEFAINNPGLVTAIATLNGSVNRTAFDKGKEPAQGYLQNQRGGKNAVPVWRPLKQDVPVPAWLFTSGAPTAAQARLDAYWRRANAVGAAATTQAFPGGEALVYRDPANSAQQVRLTVLPSSARYDVSVADLIWTQFFSHVARWTSSPNGDIGPMMTEAEVNKAFDVRTTTVGSASYKYYVKTPSNYRKGGSPPLVISLHGFGYPAWMYLSQIRMHEVGEKEGFVTVYLNGQQNRWDFTTPNGPDSDAIGQVIDDMVTHYGVDRSRVYMQGFSFGSGLAMVEGLAHPKRFAAISPDDGLGDFAPAVRSWISDLEARTPHLRMPVILFYGAVDSASSTDALIPATGQIRNAVDAIKQYDGITLADRIRTFDSPNTSAYAVLDPAGKLEPAGIDAHYPNGRFQRYDYVSDDASQLPLFSLVWVADMPHGTEPREAQLIWDYFKSWRRNADGSLVHLGR